MSEELKPCPCCGETAEIDTRQTFRGIADGRLMEALAIYCTGCTLQITVCYADVPDITTEQVIAMWNTRAQAQAAPEAEPVAWDWYNARRYGAPGERRHNVLWVDDYRRADGTIHDLDYLLESYRQGGDSGGITLHLKPLHYAPQHDAELVELLDRIVEHLEYDAIGSPSEAIAGGLAEDLRAKLASLRHV